MSNLADTFCVVGATRGTGLQIARQLLQRGSRVRVVARDPSKARQLFGEPVQVQAGDVTLPGSLRKSLDAQCRAIFFAADPTGGIGGRSFFGAEAMIREVSYQGLVNVVEVARSNGFAGRIVLLSGMGADRPSLAGALLNFIKGNLQQNQVERENYLRACGLDYTVGRGAFLTDRPAGQCGIRITLPVHRLGFGRKLARADFARVLIVAAELGSASRKTYDVFASGGKPTDEQGLMRQFEALGVADGAAV